MWQNLYELDTMSCMVVNDEQILSTEYFGHKQGKAKTNAKYLSITTKKGKNISKTNIFDSVTTAILKMNYEL